jgi:predicted membrane-bound mannosyltransferase
MQGLVGEEESAEVANPPTVIVVDVRGPLVHVLFESHFHGFAGVGASEVAYQVVGAFFGLLVILQGLLLRHRFSS